MIEKVTKQLLLITFSILTIFTIITVIHIQFEQKKLDEMTERRFSNEKPIVTTMEAPTYNATNSIETHDIGPQVHK